MRGNGLSCVLAGVAVLSLTVLLPGPARAFTELQQPGGAGASQQGASQQGASQQGATPEAVPAYRFSGNGFSLSIRPAAPSSAPSPEQELRPDRKPRAALPSDGFFERLLDSLFGDGDGD